MKNILHFLELLRLLILLPVKISNGYKKQTYQKIKRQMMFLNLL